MSVDLSLYEPHGMCCMEWNAITIFLGYKWSQTGWSFKPNVVFVVY